MNMFWLIFAAMASASPLKRELPSYVKEYAPLLHYHSAETYFISDIGAQLANSVPKVNHNTIETASPLTLDNLNDLNTQGGNTIYLTSKEGIQALPSWFNGVSPQNAATDPGKTSAVITVDKSSVGSGIVDVFYFYFYAYNRGNDVNIFRRSIGTFGNHVGDWEHVMIRFQNGKPQALWLSQHADGEAFTYDAIKKDGVRPVVYVGNGTHATWAIPGPHEHTIPNLTLPFEGLLTDQTNDGPVYDSIPASYFYSYDGTTFTSYSSDPVNYLYFQGQWGDQQLPDNAPGQINLFGQRKYSSGPNGPLFKDLMRKNVCPTKDRPCIVRPFLTP